MIQSMKILFLDIDGVINTNRAILSGLEGFDPVSCALVNMVCQQAQAQIVICSSWREDRTRTEFIEILDRCGISSGHLHVDWATPVLRTPRGLEVRAWLELHSEVRRHAILDDGIGFEDDPRFWVATDVDFGVGLPQVVSILGLLQVDFVPLFKSKGLKTTSEDRQLWQRFEASGHSSGYRPIR